MRKLALLDLEGTLIDYEFWDVMAERHERGEELRELLRRGLSASGWYETFIERVKRIVGTPRRVVEEAARLATERIRPEAKELVEELKRRGFTTMIVSGGFEDFVSEVADALGVEDYVAQKLIYHKDVVVGALPVFKEKAEIVEKVRPWFDFIFAVGDGYNDVGMLRGADVAVVVGSRAKSLAEECDAEPYESLSALVRALRDGSLNLP